MRGVLEARRPDRGAVGPDDPELASVRLHGEGELARGSCRLDRDLPVQATRSEGRDVDVVRTGPCHVRVPGAVCDERDTVDRRRALGVGSGGEVDRLSGRPTGGVEELVEVAGLRGRVRPEGQGRKTGGFDGQRFVVAAAGREVVVERLAAVSLVDVDESRAVLREERGAVAPERRCLHVADRGRRMCLDRPRPGLAVVLRREPEGAGRLQVRCRAAEEEVDRAVGLANELGV